MECMLRIVINVIAYEGIRNKFMESVMVSWVS